MSEESRRSSNVEEIEEDWCFVCKDGGNLLCCDHQGCLKVYHPQCVGLKNSVLNSSASSWDCSRHYCFICHKQPNYSCLSCPRAICGFCISKAAFGTIKGKSGMCKTCLKLAICVEGNSKLGPDGKKMNLKDRSTYECLFKEYLEIIMRKEGISLGKINHAKSELDCEDSESASDESRGSYYSTDSVESLQVQQGDEINSFSNSKFDIKTKKISGKGKKFEDKEDTVVVVSGSHSTDSGESIQVKQEDEISSFFKNEFDIKTKKLNGKRKRFEDKEYTLSGSHSTDSGESLQVKRGDEINSFSKKEFNIKSKKLSGKRKRFEDKEDTVLGSHNLDSAESLQVKRGDEINYRSDNKVDVKTKKLNGKRKMFEEKEDTGSGSCPLVNFLRSIGEDMSKKLSRYDVNAIISMYISGKNLLQHTKNVVHCDTRLYSIFKKKSVPKNSIYNLLKIYFTRESEHFYDHENEADDDEGSSGIKAESFLVACENQRASNSNVTSSPIVKESYGVQNRLSASIVVDNIKLVYLKKGLVEKLSKQPECFDDKVVGCFVKVNKDPGAKLHKNSYQLVQVGGIKRTSTDNSDKGILLQVPYMSMDVGLAMLSDDDVSEEECQDLQLKLKIGLLKKPTVGELEEKARSVHEDITKHWIETELVRLQKLVEFSNEKGNRSNVVRYLDEKEHLKRPDVQQRLLNRLPSVIPDPDEVEAEEKAAEEEARTKASVRNARRGRNNKFAQAEIFKGRKICYF